MPHTFDVKQLQRAFTVLDVKSMEDEKRVIEGIASTPSPDRMNDVVEPMGAKFALPMPLLWQHDSTKPVGEVTFAKPNKNGIPFKAKLASIGEPGTLKDRLDEAWQSLKIGLVRAVSIGFRALEYKFIENGGVHFTEWEWMELSLVTIPAQSEAVITALKHVDVFDKRDLAALGEPVTPGASGTVAERERRLAQGVKLIRAPART